MSREWFYLLAVLAVGWVLGMLALVGIVAGITAVFS